MTAPRSGSSLGGLLDGIIPTRTGVERYVRLIAPPGTVCAWEGDALRLVMPEAEKHRQRVLASLSIVYSRLEVRA